jgi:hypothetical protein
MVVATPWFDPLRFGVLGQLHPAGTTLLAVLFPLAGVALGVWVYRDASARGHRELAPFAAVVVGGVVLTGSVPGLVALAVAEDVATQGFPTALRVVPGLAALAVYLVLR